MGGGLLERGQVADELDLPCDVDISLTPLSPFRHSMDPSGLTDYIMRASLPPPLS